MGEKAQGNLIIIGGAEDKKGESIILKAFLKAARGSESRIAILTTAAEKPEEAGSEYISAFKRLGAENVGILNINTRADADSDKAVEVLQSSTGVFFTGGDQLRITSILGGTKIYTLLHELYTSGTVIAGTSAGASAMSSVMIVDGNDNDASRKCTLKMAPGLGLLEEVLIDQHFHQRGRIGRLLCGVSENPQILGIGIDEDTAVIVYPDAHFEVIGSNSVTVADGKAIKSSNVSELKPEEILAITNVVLHVLPHGYSFDMKSRQVLRHKKLEVGL